MRFKITLTGNYIRKGNMLPLSYQYEISSFIYKTLNKSDPVFTTWLHEKGYCSGNKPFKLFTFSMLNIDKFNISGDRIIILSPTINFIISFLINDAINPFILGLFKEQHIIIGDNKTQVEFDVSQISALPDIEFKEQMSFSTISPIFVDTFDPGKRYNSYISPYHPDYSIIIHNNLLEKYRLAYKKEPDKSWPVSQIKPLSEPKSKLITIKSGTENYSKIKAYNFKFGITAHPDLMRAGYYGGFGRLNSQGFGCVEQLI